MESWKWSKETKYVSS